RPWPDRRGDIALAVAGLDDDRGAIAPVHVGERLGRLNLIARLGAWTHSVESKRSETGKKGSGQKSHVELWPKWSRKRVAFGGRNAKPAAAGGVMHRVDLGGRAPARGGRRGVRSGTRLHGSGCAHVLRP